MNQWSVSIEKESLDIKIIQREVQICTQKSNIARFRFQEISIDH